MVKKKFDYNRMVSKASQASTPKIDASASGGNKYSMGIVNSKSNGKRLSFSKALAEKLQLSDLIHIAVIPEEGVVMLAKELPDGCASTGKLSGEDKKICYSADLVELLVSVFVLDFAGHVSKTFTNISFEAVEGMMVAYVEMAGAKAGGAVPNEEGASA